MTIREAFLMMGFAEGDYEKILPLGLTYRQANKLIGNSIVVNVLQALFEAMSNEKLKLTVETHPLATKDVPAILTISEESRRLEEMMRIYAPDAPAMPMEAVLVLNTNSSLIQKLSHGEFGDLASTVALQIYSLALLSAKKLDANEMKALLDASLSILEKL